MKRRTLTVALAGLLALIGAVAVLTYARQANNRAVDGLKAETVLAAKGPIRAGMTLGAAQAAGLLTSEKVPESSVSAVAVPAVTAANRQKVVTSRVATGQLLLQNMLASSAAVAATSGITIPPGTVAVTVQMCAAEAAASYLTAGSLVSFYATFPTSTKISVQRTCDVAHSAVPPGAANTKLVLANVRVLSVTHALPSSLATATTSTSALANPESSALSLDAVAVTFAVPVGDASMLIEVAEVALPYLALQPSPSADPSK